MKFLIRNIRRILVSYTILFSWRIKPCRIKIIPFFYGISNLFTLNFYSPRCFLIFLVEIPSMIEVYYIGSKLIPSCGLKMLQRLCCKQYLHIDHFPSLSQVHQVYIRLVNQNIPSHRY